MIAERPDPMDGGKGRYRTPGPSRKCPRGEARGHRETYIPNVRYVFSSLVWRPEAGGRTLCAANGTVSSLSRRRTGRHGQP